MSQKKMEAYKYAKKNRKELEKKRKRNKILAWIVSILVVAAMIGACVCLVYFTRQKTAPTADTGTETTTDEPAEIEAQDINEFLKENIKVTSDNSTTEPAEIEVETDSDSDADIEVEEVEE